MHRKVIVTSSLTFYAPNQREVALEQERQASMARDTALTAQTRAEQAQTQAEKLLIS